MANDKTPTSETEAGKRVVDFLMQFDVNLTAAGFDHAQRSTIMSVLLDTGVPHGVAH